MKKVILLILLSFLSISCAKDTPEIVIKDPVVKTLDTSFVNIGEVGTVNAKNELKDDTHIHILDDSQNITFKGKKGLSFISNFDYSVLHDGDVIIGNSKDKYLLKYLQKLNKNIKKGIVLIQASIKDLSKENKSKINIDFTPELNLKASEKRNFVKEKNIVTKNGSLKKQESDSINNEKLNPRSLNILNFKDYELINFSGQGQLLGNGLRSGRKTNFNLNKGKDLKVTINKGFLEIVPTFRGSYEFGAFKDTKLESSIDALVRYEFEVTVETSSATLGEISLPLFKAIDFPIRVPGAVPLYIDIEMEFPAGIKIGTKKAGKLTFMVKSEYALSAKTTYDTENGVNTLSFYDYVINDRKVESIASDRSYSFELFFEPRIQTKMYRVLGPYAYVNANIQADIHIPLRKSEKDIFVNFSGGVGVTFDEPIFSTTLLDIKSPGLFNFSRGWDVIGPAGKDIDEGIKLNDNITMNLTSLDEKNRIALNLRPRSLSPLGKVIITKMPSFGKIVLGPNFQSSGIVYYTPPNIIEGKDSFQIQIIDRGKTTAPSRIILQLSQRAKDQVKRGPLDITTDYNNEFISMPSNVSKIPDSSFTKWRKVPIDHEQVRKYIPVKNNRLGSSAIYKKSDCGFNDGDYQVANMEIILNSNANDLYFLTSRFEMYNNSISSDETSAVINNHLSALNLNSPNFKLSSIDTALNNAFVEISELVENQIYMKPLDKKNPRLADFEQEFIEAQRQDSEMGMHRFSVLQRYIQAYLFTFRDYGFQYETNCD